MNRILILAMTGTLTYGKAETTVKRAPLEAAAPREAMPVRGNLFRRSGQNESTVG